MMTVLVVLLTIVSRALSLALLVGLVAVAIVLGRSLAEGARR